MLKIIAVFLYTLSVFFKVRAISTIGKAIIVFLKQQ